MTHIIRQNSGFALLLALIISSVVLAIGVSILQISVNQINLSSTARESELAFQAAHAGIDCMSYWRHENAEDHYLIELPTLPEVSCFGDESISRSLRDITPATYDGNGEINMFVYEFEWGVPERRCTIVHMYILDNSTETDEILERSFANKGIGDNGQKTCKPGSVCTVLVSDGYNRACDDINSSIFSVEREITVEF